MIITSPFNIKPLNPDNIIARDNLKEVTSQLIHEPSSTKFKIDGLYSEEIFGQIGSNARINTLGYIKLNTKVLTPIVYRNLVLLKKSLFDGILKGTTYAIFKDNKFIPTDKNDPEADTGYSFFLNHFNDLKLDETESITRVNNIKMIEVCKQANAAIVDKVLVLPAGLRDVKITNGKMAIEEVNNHYLAILQLANELHYTVDIPELIKLYDGVKYNLQLKMEALYKYFLDFIDDKSGFIQRKYARRNITYGTRNVISAADLQATSPKDPSFLKYDETLLPLYQALKAYQPIVINELRVNMFSNIFSNTYTKTLLINPKTYKLEYTEISDLEINKFLTSEGLEKLINSFENPHGRLRPVSVKDINNNIFYLYLVYESDDKVILFRDIEHIQHLKGFNIKKVRPLTHLEMFYLAATEAVHKKNVLITRYPAVEIGSIYPSKVKISSTSPSRKVDVRVILGKINQEDYDNFNKEIIRVYDRYPIINSPYVDSLIMHPSRLKGTGADYDGDMTSANSVLTQTANDEINDYYKTKQNFITPTGEFLITGDREIFTSVLYNLTRKPEA